MDFAPLDGAPGEGRSILDRVADAILRNDGAPSEKSYVDRVYEALSEVLNEYAKTHGITIQQAFNEMARQFEEMATRELWGAASGRVRPAEG